MDILDVVVELQKFSHEIMQLNEPVNLEDVSDWENKQNIVLPADYKILISKFNGFSLMGTKVYGINEKDEKYSLKECYSFEHFEVANSMPLYLVPFSPDGGGNHYCFDTRTRNEISCSVCFWQHDYLYSKDDQPEIVNDSFADWIREVVIDWNLEDFDYEGNPR